MLAHSEYVTFEEYYNFKKFIENGGVMILLDSNALFAKVAYDPTNNKIIYLKVIIGHSMAKKHGEMSKKDRQLKLLNGWEIILAVLHVYYY